MKNNVTIDYTAITANGSLILALGYDSNRSKSCLISMSLRDNKLSGSCEVAVNTFTIEEIREIILALQNINDLVFSGEHVGSK